MSQTLPGELLQALRSLLRAPLYTVAVVGLLGVGIGLDVAVFSVVYRTLLRPLPVAAEDELVVLGYRSRETGERALRVSAVEIAEWGEQIGSLAGVSGYTVSELNVGFDDETRRLVGGTVAGGFFELLGVRPIAGRVFEPAEHRPGGKPVVLLGERFWRERWGGDPAALGRTLKIQGLDFEIVGVVPDGMPIGAAPAVWMPMPLDPASPRHQARVLTPIARLRADATLKGLRAELAVVSARLAAEHPQANAELTLAAEPLRERLTRAQRPTLLGLFAAAGILLLLVVVNVVFLFLVRTERRWGELVVRSALGASRAGVARLVLGELAVLAVASGVLGVAVASAGVGLFERLGLAAGAGPLGLALSAPLAGYVLGLCGLVVVAAGTGLGVRMRGAALAEGLGGVDRRGPSRRGWWLRQGIVLAEVALAVALLVGAGLTLRSVRALLAVDVGFEVDRLATASLAFPSAEYPPGSPKIAAYLAEAREALTAVPGVEAVATTITVPLVNSLEEKVTIEGEEALEPRRVSKRPVSAGYFETLGLALVRGRVFTETEAGSAVVVNEAFETELLGGASALGRRLRLGEGAASFEVVGVARSERASLDEPAAPAIYTAHAQTLWPFATLVVRGAGEVEPLLETVRRNAQALDHGVAVFDVQPLARTVAGSIERERTVATLLGVFAVLAFAIACAGVYVVFSLAVASSQRELGIRLSLGARPAEILWQVVREGLRNSLLGAAVGVIAAWQLSGLLEDVLFGVERGDPVTLGGALVVIVGSSLLACWVPARRASRVDPVVVLRGE